MKRPGHVMILASAGSGKTHALTNRFVALLAAGAEPERIVALTFTRKAAGEFFDEILNKLARAASGPAAAASLARELEAPALGTADFRRLLRGVVEAMPRLRLGTLDAFFARIVRAFPLELGLAGEFELLQPHDSRVERQRVLRRMFAATAGGLGTAQREFIEAFRRATFGADEKRLGARLDAFLDAHQENFLAAPDGALWGRAGRIWPGGCAWLEPGEGTAAEAAERLRALLARRGLPEPQQARWDAFFAALPDWRAGAPLPTPVEYLLANALAVWPGLQAGAAELTVERKKLRLDPAECAALADVVRRLVGAELGRRLEMTQGIHAVLRSYETVYHDAVRRAGRLTFGDVQRLLLPSGGGTLTRSAAAAQAERRLFIDYRLDARFDHWLLDEFQDTSYGQWSVLENLIDEVVQDSSGSRSFFCVGDVKQAIFAWREGDPRLFREIYAHYSAAAPGTIEERQLVKSWRSGPAVIGMVNAVFGRAAELASLFPGAATDAWNEVWRAHETAHPRLGGQAAWLHAPNEAARFRLTLDLLRELDPLGHGLECAVLTQHNATATQLADYLRREGGVPAVAESDLHVGADNPLGAALLALLQAAAHPGDTLAAEHVAMTPLGAVLAAEGIGSPEELTRRVLGQLQGDGFERTAEFWLRRIEPQLAPGDAFSRARARQFTAAAALFDATGGREVAEFTAFMEAHAVRDADSAGVVRVMTVHKSKGLGFDLVILPDLQGQRLDQRRDGLAVQRRRDRTVEWVLDLPKKLFYGPDETLAAHVRAAEADAAYESLSLLYVAMTRAKRAMYLITEPAGSSTSRNYPRVLTATLGDAAMPVRVGGLNLAGGWNAGEPDWVAALPPRPPPDTPDTPIPPLAAPPALRAPRRPARRPSAGKGGMVPGAALFAAEQPSDFGRAVHALLAAVEWAEGGPASDTAAAWAAEGAAGALALACLRAPSLAAVWAKPADLPLAEVWRERSFEVVLDGAWVAGVFDRVVVARDATGAVRRATVFDFKTDAVADEAALASAATRHAPQLQFYRRVAAMLTGLEPAAVRAELVFTRVQRTMALAS